MVISFDGDTQDGLAVFEQQIALQTDLPVLDVPTRIRILETVRDSILERQEELALLITDEVRKPITQARHEVMRTAETFDLAARAVLSDRKPIGIVGAISPFNFPLNLAAHKIASAVAAGCPIIHKPSSRATRTSRSLYDMVIAAGLPEDYYILLMGPGEVVGDLLLDDRIAWLEFMGSTEVGVEFAEHARRAFHNKLNLELGNAAPMIVCLDADVDQAIDKIVHQGYVCSGQSCIAAQRIIFMRGLYDQFSEQLARAVSVIPYGDPHDPKTVVGPLISQKECDRVLRWVKEDISNGAKLLVGDLQARDQVIAPILLGNVTPDMQVARGEIFGPVVCLMPVDTLEEAIEIANSGPHGVQAWVFSGDETHAREWALQLDFDGVTVNQTRVKSRLLGPTHAVAALTNPCG